MFQIKINFSNGEHLLLTDSDVLTPIASLPDNSSRSIAPSVEMLVHPTDGLIPSFLEFIDKYDVFYHGDDRNIIYFSKAIVSIEKA